ncbi:MAG: hypothetical protein L0G70_10545, partial [Rubrobacter sp.]|nr:hypothetical protein [Rubrobacter sp.]
MKNVNDLKTAVGKLKTLYENHRNLDALLAENTRLKRELEDVSHPERKVKPENIIWIFGTARTGSTWLARMLSTMPKHVLWNEPLLGDLLGNMSERLWEYRLSRQDFVFGGNGSYDTVRRFGLDSALKRFPRIGPTVSVLIKAPH